jgi:lysophospholipase L1-like esterase
MKKIVKSWSIFLVMFIFVTVNYLSFVPVKGAQVKLPKLAFVGVEHSQLVYGETENFVLSSTNFVGKVQYRIWLNNKNTDIWTDITGGYSAAVDAKDTFIFKYDKSFEPGNYNVSAWVKIAGTEGMKLNKYGLGYDNYGVTAFECVKSVEAQNVYTALGDSISFGLSASQGNGYVNLLHNYLTSTEKFSNEKLNNLSKPGDTSSDLLAKLKTDATIRESVKMSNIITISIGGNNILSPLIQAILVAYKVNPADPNFQKNLAIAIATDPNAIETIKNLLTSEQLMTALKLGTAQFMADSQAIIQEIKLLSPKAEIYVSTLYNPFNPKDPVFNLVDPSIKAVNSMFSTPNPLFKVADVYTLFNQYAGDKPLTNLNFLTGNIDPHPTDEGHKLILQAHINAK